MADAMVHLETQQAAAAAFVVFMVFAVGLDVSVSHLRTVARRWPVVIRALLANYVAVPALVWMGVSAMALPHVYAAGILLVAAAPGGPVGAVLVQKSRGDVALAVSLLAITNVLNTVMTPALAVLLGVVSGGADAPIGGMVKSIVAFQLVPLCMAMSWRHWFPVSAAVARNWLNKATHVAIGGAVVFGLVVEGQRALDAPAEVLVAALIPPVAGIIAGALVTRRGPRESGTVSIMTGFRSMSIVLLLISEWFPRFDTLLAAMLCSVIMLPICVAAGWTMRRAINQTPR